MEGFKDWLRDLLLWFPRKIYELVLDGLAWVIEQIPVPAWLDNAGSYFAALDPGITYFLEAFEFTTGIGILVAAYVLRFLIRRIPVIG